MKLIKRRGDGGLLPSLNSNLLEVFDIDNFLSEPFQFPLLNTTAFSRVPATNIQQTNDEYIVEIAAPGLKKKDFKVDVDNGMLEIMVENEEKAEEKEGEYTRREYNYNAFCRSFTLPKSVNPDKIKAAYEDGILKVHLPLIPEARKKPPKEIAIA